MKVDIFSDFMTVDLETTCLVLVIFITLSAAAMRILILVRRKLFRKRDILQPCIHD